MRAQPRKRLPYLKRRRVEVFKLAKGGGDDVLDLVWVLPEVHTKITCRMSHIEAQRQPLTDELVFQWHVRQIARRGRIQDLLVFNMYPGNSALKELLKHDR